MKLRNLKLSLVWMMLVQVGASCQDDEQNISKLEDCNLENLVKSLVDAEGVIWYDSLSQQYCVFTGIDGSYDSQDIGIPCNLAVNYQKQGFKVSFDGNYYNCEEFHTPIPGQTYYYLELTKIKSSSEN